MERQYLRVFFGRHGGSTPLYASAVMSRVVARALAGSFAVLSAQCAFLAASYVTPADAEGPHHGICVPLVDAKTREAAARWWSAHRVAAAPWAPFTSRQMGSSPQAAAPCAPRAATQLRVLVLGDSLVSGVGGDVASSPRLPARFASALAEKLGAHISWRAYGETGADIDAMRKVLLPALRLDAETATTKPAVVVLLCGLNDFKRLPLGATPHAFRDNLQTLLADIRALTGPQTLLVLPALPMQMVQRFPSPLHQVAVAAAARWDDEKRLLAEACRGVVFVTAPTISPREATHLLSSDGVHPNCEGYARWGEHIAAAVVAKLMEVQHSREREARPHS